MTKTSTGAFVARRRASKRPAPIGAFGTSLFSALQEQLGLKLADGGASCTRRNPAVDKHGLARVVLARVGGQGKTTAPSRSCGAPGRLMGMRSMMYSNHSLFS